MIYKSDDKYYILVSSGRLVRVNVTQSGDGIVLEPTKEEIRLLNDGEIVKYQQTTANEIKKELEISKKEIIKPKEDFGSKLIKPKNKN